MAAQKFSVGAPVKPRAYNILAACMLIVAVGGNLAFLQCAAWMGMLLSYSQQDGIAVGIQKTFDGKHPCKICKVVKKGEQNEQAKKLVKPSVKVDWMLPETAGFSWNSTSTEEQRPPNVGALLKFQLPPTPPPEFA